MPSATQRLLLFATAAAAVAVGVAAAYSVGDAEAGEEAAAVAASEALAKAKAEAEEKARAEAAATESLAKEAERVKAAQARAKAKAEAEAATVQLWADELLEAEDAIDLMDAVCTNDVAAVKKLIKAGADVNAVTARASMTALHFAAGLGEQDPKATALKLLLAAGARADATDSLGAKTPLHYAAEDAFVAACEALGAKGSKALIDAVDKDGMSPLMLAASNRKGRPAHEWDKQAAKVAKMLINFGADVNLTAAVDGVEGAEITALHAATVEGLSETAAVLRAAGGVDPAALFECAARGDDKGAAASLASGESDANRPDKDGNTPLIVLCMNQLEVRPSRPAGGASAIWSIARTLRDRGTGATLRSACGGSPHLLIPAHQHQHQLQVEAWAFDHRAKKMAATLLNAGANPNARNKSGESALRWAQKSQLADTRAVLLAAGAVE